MDYVPRCLIKLVYGSSHVQHCIQYDHMYRLCGGVEIGLDDTVVNGMV